MAGNDVSRGDVWDVSLDPTAGREQRGTRPMLILSIGQMNRSAAELVIGVPTTTTDWENRLHVRIDSSAAGLDRVSYAMPEMARSVSLGRLHQRRGTAPIDIVDRAAKNVGLLIGLGRVR